jgi:hypothetical protein
MDKNKKAASDQSQRFIETARALGCDEDKERFEAALGKIARQRHKKESGRGPEKPETKKPGQ